jgi:signal transduction histidine kinase
VLTNTGATLSSPTIDPNYLERFTHQSSVFTSNMKGLLPDDCAVACSPIVMQGESVGMVFSIMPLGAMGDFLWDVLQMLLVAALLSVILVSFGAYFMASALVMPLTQMSKAAERLAQGDFSCRIHHHREDEIGQLADAFNQMTLSLEAGEKMRYGFVANVSHELKTPMTTIAGFMDGMLDGTIPPAQHRHYMQIVSDEVRRLSRLVRSMLEISRLQSQGIREESKRRFNLCETVGQVLISFEQKINEKQLDVQVDMPEHPVFTFASEDAITQVIYNLVDNAVKFCPEGGVLSLFVRVGGSKVYVGVSNEGEVIPPEELPLVFDRFHKTDKSRSRNRDSWGLGLYIVRTIIDSHGENISVTSRENKTSFTFTLPLVN